MCQQKIRSNILKAAAPGQDSESVVKKVVQEKLKKIKVKI